jgi:hypothetical protein
LQLLVTTTVSATVPTSVLRRRAPEDVRHFFGSAAFAGTSDDVLVVLDALFLCFRAVFVVLVPLVLFVDLVIAASLVDLVSALGASAALVGAVEGAGVAAGAGIVVGAGVVAGAGVGAVPWANAVAANAAAIRAVNSLVIMISS